MIPRASVLPPPRCSRRTDHFVSKRGARKARSEAPYPRSEVAFRKLPPAALHPRVQNRLRHVSLHFFLCWLARLLSVSQKPRPASYLSPPFVLSGSGKAIVGGINLNCFHP